MLEVATCTNSRPVKRKRVVLSLETKLTILDRNSKGESQVKLATEYGIGTSTVGDIIKNADKIKSFALTMDTLSMNKKGRNFNFTIWFHIYRYFNIWIGVTQAEKYA